MESRSELNVVTAAGTGASGLASRAARWALVFVWATGIARGVVEGVFSPPTPLMIAAHLAVLVGAFLLTARGDRPLCRGRGLGVVAVALAASLVATVSTTTAADVWLLDFSAYLLALMLARGNPVLGLGGGAVQVLFVVGWAIVTAQSPSGVVTMLAIPLLSYILGVVWRIVLRWIVAREREHRSERALSEQRAAAADLATERFRVELADVRAEVRESLEALGDGAEIDDAVRARLAVLEGAIRDRIRSPGLSHPVIAAALADARSRGVRVAVLAHTPDRPSAIDDAAATRIADVVRGVSDGEVVIGATAQEPGTITVVTDGSRPGRTVLRDALLPIAAPARG